MVDALTGLVRPHHRFMLQVLHHLDHLNVRIDALNQQIGSSWLRMLTSSHA
ncbi:hypothetical protein KFU94_42925 [Chloroflexi bacterium TSY]|nr:hypothetical protein [Chloroflexi bacterium TSY]